MASFPGYTIVSNNVVNSFVISRVDYCNCDYCISASKMTYNVSGGALNSAQSNDYCKACWLGFHSFNSTSYSLCWTQQCDYSSARRSTTASSTCCGIAFTGFAPHSASSPTCVCRCYADVQGTPWSGTAVYRRSLPTSHISWQQIETPIRHSRRPRGQLLRHALGARAFAVAGPKARNQLLAHLRALETVGPFKMALKAYLHSIQWLCQIVWHAAPLCWLYSCYGALEIVGAIIIIINRFQINYNITITLTLNVRQQVDWLYIIYKVMHGPCEVQKG